MSVIIKSNAGKTDLFKTKCSSKNLYLITVIYFYRMIYN